MNKNELKGKFEQAKGAVQRETGKATGDAGRQLKGTYNTAKGQIRETIGREQAEREEE